MTLSDVLSQYRYKIRMTSVPSGYSIDTVDKSVVVDTGSTTNVTWSISKVKGQIKILTYAGEDSELVQIRSNTLLTGVGYDIYDTNGTLVSRITDDGGYCYSGSLDFGTYYVKQTTAPSGFSPNTKRITANVSTENKAIQITVYDQAVDYTSSLTIKGPSYMYAGKTGKFYLSNIKASTTSSMENFYINIKIPTDCLRTRKFFTTSFLRPDIEGIILCYYL